MRTKAILFVSMLFLVFSTTSCKKSGEADVAEVEAVAEIEAGADAEDVAEAVVEDEVEAEIEAVEKE